MAEQPDRTKLTSYRAVPVGMALPPPINDRLYALVDMARASGDPHVSRRDIVAALILNSPNTEAGIQQVLRKYQRADARAAALRDSEPATPRPRRPGPVPRRRRAEEGK